MRGSVVGSGLVHLAVIVVLFLVRAASPIVIPGPDIVQVALVEPSTAATYTPPPPEPEPIRETPKIEPTEESGVKIAQPEKPKPKPPPKEQPKPRETSTMASPALPYRSMGSPGLRGAISVDASDFEFTYYLMLVRDRIAQNWSPPAGVAGSAQAVIYFRIGRDGRLAGVRVETGSGQEFFDRTATRAVVLSDPMPPLPLGFTGSDLGVHFGFEYAP